jgi:hypothetical protein
VEPTIVAPSGVHGDIPPETQHSRQSRRTNRYRFSRLQSVSK